jgi:drug/metabolite transporter (DMT)-like permease
MFYIVATILLNVVISVLFKLFPKYKIDILQAIVANYCVCVVTGCISIGHIPFTVEAIHADWLAWALGMGLAFICIFNLLAYSTRVDGITTTIIASKLSLVIPVIFSLIVYKEHATIAKIAGILLAFPAVYLTTRVEGDNHKPQNLLWPVLIFLGGGMLDTATNYIQLHFLHTTGAEAAYTIFVFATAAAAGLILIIVLLLLKKIRLQWRNLIAGIFVGVPNYFSIYFFIRALNSNFLESSASIPVLNIGILAASALTAILLFKEHVNTLRIIGMAMSVIAILLIAFGNK